MLCFCAEILIDATFGRVLVRQQRRPSSNDMTAIFTLVLGLTGSVIGICESGGNWWRGEGGAENYCNK
jgi:hypothetical protein